MSGLPEVRARTSALVVEELDRVDASLDLDQAHPDHLGLSPPGQEQPAPTPEVVRVPVDDEGREILAG